MSTYPYQDFHFLFLLKNILISKEDLKRPKSNNNNGDRKMNNNYQKLRKYSFQRALGITK